MWSVKTVGCIYDDEVPRWLGVKPSAVPRVSRDNTPVGAFYCHYHLLKRNSFTWVP